LKVHVRDMANAANRMTTSLAAVPLELIPGAPMQDLSRFIDSPKWIAGEYVTDGPWACTSGIPAERNGDNRPYLITAAHCCVDGDAVTTGQTGSYGPHFIGWVTMRNNLHDAIAVDTSSTGHTASREWDGPDDHVYQLDGGTSFSWNGDWVCQDGFVSAIVC